MAIIQRLRQQLGIRRSFAVQFIAILVAADGLFILATTLLDQLAVHHGSRVTDIDVDPQLLIGLGLVYLGTLLRRHKRTAWLVTFAAYGCYMVLSLLELQRRGHMHNLEGLLVVRLLILPLLVMGLLWIFRREFVARSDIQGFRSAARLSLIILLVAFVYGVAGFSLLDKSDFHQEIGFTTAMHYTVDQFDLTTQPLQPHTKRAHLFVDSLSVVSTAAVVYAVLALFQPLRFRLTDQTAARQRMLDLLTKYGSLSEDFFKLWPHDKHYFFEQQGDSGLAFHVARGVALCLGDPAGDSRHYKQLMSQFSDMCFGNDWLPAFIHVEATYRALYEKQGFALQKLGQEAIVDLEHFAADVAGNKYFRNIASKFAKQGYSCELLQPPHHSAVLARLATISEEWLDRGGHAERSFVMGYFTPEYMQQCSIFVARDAAGTIQGFINQIPAPFDLEEADFDMLRQANNSLGNINDYLLMNFIETLRQAGYKRLNMGLCALVGLDKGDAQANLVDTVLRFAYANGDRFYSFSGLHRFKAKYEPDWQDRYVAYQGGVAGFSRTMSALMKAMQVKR